MSSLGIVIASQKAVDDLGESTVQNKLSNISSYVQNRFDEDIKQSGSEYKLYFTHDSDLNYTVDLTEENSSITDWEEATYASQNAVDNQQGILTSSYDVRVVFDTRNNLGANGGSEPGGAGDSNNGTAWVCNDTPPKTAAHELGHLYGATDYENSYTEHNTFQYGGFGRHSLMGKSLNRDCDGNQHLTITGNWFSECAAEGIREHSVW